MSDLIDRDAARAAGLKTYNSDPCAKHHGAERYIQNKACVVCSKEHSAAGVAKSAALAAEKKAKAAKVTAAEARGLRECQDCLTEKPFTGEHFPFQRGQAVGFVCKPCMTARKMTGVYAMTEKAARAAALADIVMMAGGVQAAPAATPEWLRDATPAPALALDAVPDKQLPVVAGDAKSMKKAIIRATTDAGTKIIASAAPTALAHLMLHLNNPTSPLYEWSLKFVLERAAPEKAYAASAENELGGWRNAAHDAGITFVVNVVQASPAGLNNAKVIDVALVDDVIDAELKKA